jgi:hypothetical protein
MTRDELEAYALPAPCLNSSRRRMKTSANGPLRPEDFPLGSPESRAAARVRLDGRDGDSRRIEVISHIPRPWTGSGPEPADWNKVPRFGPWRDCGDVLVRVVYQPVR